MSAKQVREQVSFRNRLLERTPLPRYGSRISVLRSNKKTGHISVSRFRLGVSHLLDFEHALAALALDDLFSSHASLAALA